MLPAAAVIMHTGKRGKRLLYISKYEPLNSVTAKNDVNHSIRETTKIGIFVGLVDMKCPRKKKGRMIKIISRDNGICILNDDMRNPEKDKKNEKRTLVLKLWVRRSSNSDSRPPKNRANKNQRNGILPT